MNKMRRRIVAGNWKMNKSFDEAEDLLEELTSLAETGMPRGVDIVVCTPFLYLELAGDLFSETSIAIGAQNCYPADNGAFTGEISVMMLASIEVDYCIVGHSERRKYFTESDEFIGEKVKATLHHDIVPIFCCGELLQEREASSHFEVVENQLKNSLFNLSSDDFSKIVIAYEPVWAIGTGVNASPEQAQEMHAFIRSLIAKKYGDKIASATSILYGGSCTSANAMSLFSQPDIDGGLIGGASLKANEFWAIANAF